MMMTSAIFWVLALAQAPSQATLPAPPATFIGSAEMESTLRESIANNTPDKRVALAPGPRGIVRVGIVHRSKQEPRALLHEELTEIYQIIEGSGTLVTGGTTTDCAPVADPPNLGPTRSYYCTMTAGVSQKVKPKDMVIVPAGTPHKFSELDGPISYVIYRFEAPQGK